MATAASGASRPQPTLANESCAWASWTTDRPESASTGTSAPWHAYLDRFLDQASPKQPCMPEREKHWMPRMMCFCGRQREDFVPGRGSSTRHKAPDGAVDHIRMMQRGGRAAGVHAQLAMRRRADARIGPCYRCVLRRTGATAPLSAALAVTAGVGGSGTTRARPEPR